MKPIQSSPAINTETLQSSAPISLKPPHVDQHEFFYDNDFSNQPIVKKANTTPIKATFYIVADLQMATGSFSMDNLVGEGSIGRVYRAHLNDGKVLAVKKINSSALPNQSIEGFIEAVSKISQLHHPNVTELVGYCSEHGQHFLGYLHEVCSPSIVHKNFKSVNILLDAELNPHISDCVLASFVPDVEYHVKL